MSLQTRLVSNLYRRARSCSEAGYPASLQHLYLHKKILPLQIVQSCYRKLCIVVTEIGALLLPKSEHSRLPKSVHFPLPFTYRQYRQPGHRPHRSQDGLRRRLHPDSHRIKHRRDKQILIVCRADIQLLNLSEGYQYSSSLKKFIHIDYQYIM